MKNNKTPLILLIVIVLTLTGTFFIVNHDMNQLPEFKVDTKVDKYNIKDNLVIDIMLNSENGNMPSWEYAYVNKGKTIYPSYVGDYFPRIQSKNYPKPFLKAIEKKGHKLLKVSHFVNETPNLLSFMYVDWKENPKLVVMKYDLDHQKMFDQTIDLPSDSIKPFDKNFTFEIITAYETPTKIFFMIPELSDYKVIETNKEKNHLKVSDIYSLGIAGAQTVVSEAGWMTFDNEDAKLLIREAREGQKDNIFTINLSTQEKSQAYNIENEDISLHQMGSKFLTIDYQKNEIKTYTMDNIGAIAGEEAKSIDTMKLQNDDTHSFSVFTRDNTLNLVENTGANQKTYKKLDLMTKEVVLEYSLTNLKPHNVLTQWNMSNDNIFNLK
ncbi:hypothetical protein [Atopobacter phocae]|uniref:hypothetical protein n=1 Tax=Atopobacter phocae TaxID=136492 RepID=UPI00046FADE4|nr:hypothetical protein [Atopobacter phocae]